MPKLLIVSLLLAFSSAILLDAKAVVLAQRTDPIVQERINSVIRELSSQDLEISRLKDSVQALSLLSEKRITALETTSESQTWYLRVTAAAVIGMLVSALAERRKRKQQEQ